MPGFAAILWDLLTVAGGTLALSLIVSIAVGINALTFLFVGSAVVTLERFARVARRPRSVAVVGGFMDAPGSRAGGEGRGARRGTPSPDYLSA